MSIAVLPEVMTCEELRVQHAADDRARNTARLCSSVCATIKTLLGAVCMLSMLNLAGSFL